MTWSSLLQKWKEIWTMMMDKEKASPDKEKKVDTLQEVDIKLVFQDTKKSLESLKQLIFSHTDVEKRKEREQHILQYVDRLLWFSALEQTDKDLLVTIKNNLSHAQESDIETIILVVSHLEQKAEHLTEVDREKVRELNETLIKHRQFLSLLKEGVSSPIPPTLEEAKIQTFDRLKKKLEEHRWSAWLAQPVYDYLMEKHINKKPVSKFKDWLMGAVWLTIVGWFVGKDLKKLIENIDTLSVEDLIGSLGGEVEKVKNTLADLSPERFEIEKKRFEDIMFPFFEKQLWRPLDRAKFTSVCNSWFDKWKSKISLWEKVATFNEALAWNGEFDLFGETVWLLVAPPRAVLDFVVDMKQAWLISWNDIIIDWVLLPSWKAVLKLGIWSVWLFANTMKTIFTSMSAEELSEYVKEHSDRLDVDSKLALWWLLYRRWWWFWNLAGHVWTLFGEWLSTLFMQRTWSDVGKISAYWKWWVMANFQKNYRYLNN
jgi:hypothetical protein